MSFEKPKKFEELTKEEKKERRESEFKKEVRAKEAIEMLEKDFDELPEDIKKKIAERYEL